MWCQNIEINRLRTTTLELKCDLKSRCEELQNTSAQLDKAKAQVQLNRDQVENLRREKIHLEKQMTEMKQKAVKVHTLPLTITLFTSTMEHRVLNYLYVCMTQVKQETKVKVCTHLDWL